MDADRIDCFVLPLLRRLGCHVGAGPSFALEALDKIIDPDALHVGDMAGEAVSPDKAEQWLDAACLALRKGGNEESSAKVRKLYDGLATRPSHWMVSPDPATTTTGCPDVVGGRIYRLNPDTVRKVVILLARISHPSGQRVEHNENPIAVEGWRGFGASLRRSFLLATHTSKPNATCAALVKHKPASQPLAPISTSVLKQLDDLPQAPPHPPLPPLPAPPRPAPDWASWLIDGPSLGEDETDGDKVTAGLSLSLHPACPQVVITESSAVQAALDAVAGRGTPMFKWDGTKWAFANHPSSAMVTVLGWTPEAFEAALAPVLLTATRIRQIVDCVRSISPTSGPTLQRFCEAVEEEIRTVWSDLLQRPRPRTLLALRRHLQQAVVTTSVISHLLDGNEFPGGCALLQALYTSSCRHLTSSSGLDNLSLRLLNAALRPLLHSITLFVHGKPTSKHLRADGHVMWEGSLLPPFLHAVGVAVAQTGSNIRDVESLHQGHPVTALPPTNPTQGIQSLLAAIAEDPLRSLPILSGVGRTIGDAKAVFDKIHDVEEFRRGMRAEGCQEEEEAAGEPCDAPDVIQVPRHWPGSLEYTRAMKTKAEKQAELRKALDSQLHEKKMLAERAAEEERQERAAAAALSPQGFTQEQIAAAKDKVLEEYTEKMAKAEVARRRAEWRVRRWRLGWKRRLFFATKYEWDVPVIELDETQRAEERREELVKAVKQWWVSPPTDWCSRYMTNPSLPEKPFLFHIGVWVGSPIIGNDTLPPDSVIPCGCGGECSVAVVRESDVKPPSVPLTAPVTPHRGEGVSEPDAADTEVLVPEGKVESEGLEDSVGDEESEGEHSASELFEPEPETPAVESTEDTGQAEVEAPAPGPTLVAACALVALSASVAVPSRENRASGPRCIAALQDVLERTRAASDEQQPTALSPPRPPPGLPGSRLREVLEDLHRRCFSPDSPLCTPEDLPHEMHHVVLPPEIAVRLTVGRAVGAQKSAVDAAVQEVVTQRARLGDHLAMLHAVFLGTDSAFAAEVADVVDLAAARRLYPSDAASRLRLALRRVQLLDPTSGEYRLCGALTTCFRVEVLPGIATRSGGLAARSGRSEHAEDYIEFHYTTADRLQHVITDLHLRVYATLQRLLLALRSAVHVTATSLKPIAKLPRKPETVALALLRFEVQSVLQGILGYYSDGIRAATRSLSKVLSDPAHPKHPRSVPGYRSMHSAFIEGLQRFTMLNTNLKAQLKRVRELIRIALELPALHAGHVSMSAVGSFQAQFENARKYLVDSFIAMQISSADERHSPNASHDDVVSWPSRAQWSKELLARIDPKGATRVTL